MRVAFTLDDRWSPDDLRTAVGRTIVVGGADSELISAGVDDVGRTHITAEVPDGSPAAALIRSDGGRYYSLRPPSDDQDLWHPAAAARRPGLEAGLDPAGRRPRQAVDWLHAIPSVPSTHPIA